MEVVLGLEEYKHPKTSMRKIGHLVLNHSWPVENIRKVLPSMHSMLGLEAMEDNPKQKIPCDFRTPVLNHFHPSRKCLQTFTKERQHWDWRLRKASKATSIEALLKDVLTCKKDKHKTKRMSSVGSLLRLFSWHAQHSIYSCMFINNDIMI